MAVRKKDPRVLDNLSTNDRLRRERLSRTSFEKIMQEGFVGIAADLGIPVTSTPTNSPTPSITPSNTPTASVTPSQTATNTPTPSVTKSPTPSVTKSPTPSNTLTATPTQTETPTNTPTITNTCTPTLTIGVTPSETPSETRSETPTQTPTPSNSPTPIATSTLTPSPTNTPTSSQTSTPSITPSITPSTTPNPFSYCVEGNNTVEDISLFSAENYLDSFCFNGVSTGGLPAIPPMRIWVDGRARIQVDFESTRISQPFGYSLQGFNKSYPQFFSTFIAGNVYFNTGATPTPTQTPTQTLTPTRIPGITPTATSTASSLPTTPTPTPPTTPTLSGNPATPTPTPSVTLSGNPATPTPTPSVTLSGNPATPTPTASGLPVTPTTTPTPTPTPTQTLTPTRIPGTTPTASGLPVTPTTTATPSVTPSLTSSTNFLFSLVGPENVSPGQKIEINSVSPYNYADTVYFNNGGSSIDFVTMTVNLSGSFRSFINFTTDRLGTSFGYKLNSTPGNNYQFTGIFVNGVVNLS
jgi:hypothetical protein